MQRFVFKWIRSNGGSSMVDIITKSGKRIGKISDDMSYEDIVYVEGKPMHLSDVYNNPELKRKFNDEIKETSNAIEFQD